MKTLAFALLSACALASAADPPRPNIILAMADDMGWGDPSCYSQGVSFANGQPHPDRGWIQTPTMDAMAANGLKFNRFYAASAVCSPTRASCLTGRNPFRVGIPFANQGKLGFDETALSGILAGVGYQCGHFGKWHLGTLTTLREDSNRGPDATVYSAPWHHDYHACFVTESRVPTYHPYRIASNSAALPTSFSDPNFFGTHYWRMPPSFNEFEGEGLVVPVGEVNDALNGDDSKLLVDQAIPFIRDAVANDEPFFVVLWFHTPHKEVIDPDGVTSVDSPDALKDSIEDMDAALGTLRNELVDLGVRNNTMLWMTSDNGPEDGIDSPNESSTSRSIRAGRFFRRKRSLYEGGVRVPAVLEWPDAISASRATDYPAVTSDYYPTILDYLELSVPGQKPLDGISLRPLIEDTVTTRSQPIGFKINAHRSWTSHQFKLIDAGSGWELHDLINIPAGQEPEESPIATEANIGSQAEDIQEIYQELLDEFNAWDASVSSDTVYPHPSRPSVALTTTAGSVDQAFEVQVAFSESVTQLQEEDFVLENAAVGSLSGTGSEFTLGITPDPGAELVTVSLPEASAFDFEGNPSLPSNAVMVGDLPLVPELPLTIEVDFGTGTQTPGNYNNVVSAGTIDLIDDGGASTGISFDLAGGSFAGSQAFYNGPYPARLASVPTSALQDSLFIRANNNGNSATLTLDGMAVGASYEFTIYGARGNNGLESIWHITDRNGTTTHSLEPFNNATEVITVSNLTPTPDGRMAIQYTSEAATTEGAAMNYWRIETDGVIDTDRDGMPDNYEILNGTDPNGDDADSDLDLDQLTNLQEFLGKDSGDNGSGFGQTRSGSADSDGDGQDDGDEVNVTNTNPNDGSSFFEVTEFVNSVADVRISWVGVEDRSYEVQWSIDARNWATAESLPGSNGVMSSVVAKGPIDELDGINGNLDFLFLRVRASLSP